MGSARHALQLAPRAPGTVVLASLCLLAGVLAGAPSARAQDCARCTTVGEGTDGLPGLRDVPIAELRPGLSGAITGWAGYGISVDEPWAGTTRHRVEGGLAGAIHVLPWLAFGAQLQGRWESVSMGNSDTGLIGIPVLTARLTMEPVEGLGLGLDVATWMYGGEAPSLEPASTSLRARAIGSYRARLDARTALTVGITAGGLLDNSRAAAPRSVTDALSDADRLSLGVSDFSAVLLGAGAALRLDTLELLVEGTYRVLVGDGAPSAGAMPLHVVFGGRVRPIGEVLEIGLYLDVSASEARPELVASGGPAAPIDPRFTATLQATVRLGVGPSDAVVDEVEGDGEDGRDARVTTTGETAGSISGRVVDDAGAPVAAATIEVTPAGAAEGSEPLRTTSGADGRWTIEGVPPGPARVVVRTEGRDPIEQTVEVGAGAAVQSPDARVAAALPRGEIRGVVQGADGSPLAAQIRIEPLGLELTCDADGAFEAEVPPGAYQVTVRAPGHRAQTRAVEVAERGVVVLNAQLHRQR